MRARICLALGSLVVVCSFSLGTPPIARAQVLETDSCKLHLDPEEASQLLHSLTNGPRARSRIRAASGAFLLSTGIKQVNRLRQDTGFSANLIVNESFEIRSVGGRPDPNQRPVHVSLDRRVDLFYDATTQTLGVATDRGGIASLPITFDATSVFPLPSSAQRGRSVVTSDVIERTSGEIFGLALNEDRSGARQTVRVIAQFPGRITSFLSCDPVAKSVEFGRTLRADLDLTLEIPGPALEQDADGSQTDMVRVIISGENRVFSNAPEDPSMPFSESRVTNVSRATIARRVDLQATGAGLLAGLRLRAAPRPRDVVEPLLSPDLQIAVQLDSQPFLVINGQSAR